MGNKKLEELNSISDLSWAKFDVVEESYYIKIFL